MSETLQKKQFVAEVKAEGARRRRFVISTSGVDRDNDVIDQNGWDLAAYQRNPVVLWAHDYASLPVGKCVSIVVEGGRLVAIVEFAPAELSAFAEQVLGLIDGGFLNAVSVGFKPKKTAHNHARGGLDFLEMELLEFSIVPVPANAQALLVGRSADSPALKAWLATAQPDDEDVLVLDDEDDDVLGRAIREGATAGMAAWRSKDPTVDRAARRQHVAGDLDIDPAVLRDVLATETAAAIRSELAAVIGNEIATAVRRSRGRLD